MPKNLVSLSFCEKSECENENLVLPNTLKYLRIDGYENWNEYRFIDLKNFPTNIEVLFLSCPFCIHHFAENFTWTPNLKLRYIEFDNEYLDIPKFAYNKKDLVDCSEYISIFYEGC